MFIPSVIFLLILQTQIKERIRSQQHADDGVADAHRPATAVPLLLFGAAARKISRPCCGRCNISAPTMQFLIGVWLYKEPFTFANLIGFCIIWVALILLWGKGIAITGGRGPWLSDPENHYLETSSGNFARMNSKAR